MKATPLLKRLSWAGVLFSYDGQSLVIDGLEGKNGEVQGRIGPNLLPLMPISTGHIDFAVVTHLHKDHFDLEALKRRLGPAGVLYAPLATLSELSESGLKVVGVKDRESVQAGKFRLIAVPAVDGFGAPQSSWIIEAGGVRFFHGGDTLFHGYWWEIARIADGVDVAFLPINGARIAIPGLEATGLPGVMTAPQAAVAARLLKAKLTVPIHYQEFNHPPVYNPDPDAEASFLESAAREKVPARIISAGDAVALS